MPKYILDTHALVWFLEGNPRLGDAARTIMSDDTSEMVLPIIALAEAAFIIERGRTSIPTTSQLIKSVLADPRIEIYPLNMEVFERSLKPDMVQIPELHDRLIVSTALYFQDSGEVIALLTKDQIITTSGVVPIVWK